MIGLDTNVLVRLIAADDHAQERAVLRLLARSNETFFISDVTVAELVWVLSSLYEFTRDELFCALEALTSRADLVFENEIRVRGAMHYFNEGGDFADFLILARAEIEGCAAFASFDKGLKKRFPKLVVVPA